MADLTDDIAALRDIADDDDFVSPLARVLLHLLDRDTDPEPPERSIICPTEGCDRAVGHDRGHAKFGDPIPPAPEPAVTADHQTTVEVVASGTRYRWRCSCGKYGEWDRPSMASLEAFAHVTEAERDEARARADAAEQENADLRASIEYEAARLNRLTSYETARRLRALLAGPPEGSEA